MPPGEEMFTYHGYSGPCPAPPVTDPALATVAENYHTVFNDRRDLDDDLPDDVRRELMQAAVANGRVSYHWLCAIYRRGLRDGGAATARAAALVVEKHADEVLALRLERDALNKTRAEIWENPEQWMKWCDLRVLERAEAAEQALTEKEQATILDRWNYSGQPSVSAYNHAVDVANANYRRAEATEAEARERRAKDRP